MQAHTTLSQSIVKFGPMVFTVENNSLNPKQYLQQGYCQAQPTKAKHGISPKSWGTNTQNEDKVLPLVNAC
jgi:hypothetical protein